MSIRKPYIPLAVLALLLAWAVPAGAETAASLSCVAGASPPAESAIGIPGSQPAQSTCGPCLLQFCADVGIRCNFTGCGRNDCCAYSCGCDLSCTSGGVPGNTCIFLLPENCLCGNNMAEGEEDCDGTDLRGETCVSRGFDGGTLGCTSGCRFDTSDCHECGNGEQENGEDCDGFDLGGETCLSLGFDGGDLACNGDCTFDTSDCHKCGNLTCEGPEDCESCSTDCDSRTTGPPTLRFCCGNGIAESAEGAGCSVCAGNC